MEAAQPILVALFAITVMGSVGVDLTIDRVWVVFRRPRTLVVGLFLNHLAVPLLALGIARVCQLNEAVTVGFILCASAPGGPVGAMFTQRAKGNVAFAASLIVVMTALNTVTTPLLMGWLIDTEIGDAGASHVWPVMKTILLYLLSPLLFGMLLRYHRPQAAGIAFRWLKRTNNVIFAVFFVGMVATQWGVVGEMGSDMGVTPFVAMLVLAACCAVSGFLVAGKQRDLRVALALNTTMRNVALSLLLADIWFTNQQTIMTVMIYGLGMILVALPATLMLRRGGVVSSSS
mgnify:FL=1